MLTLKAPAFVQMGLLYVSDVRWGRLLRLLFGVGGVAYAVSELRGLAIYFGTGHAVGVLYIVGAIVIASWLLPGFVREHKPAKK